MPTQDEVTLWMRKLGDRDGQAAQQIWDRYFTRLAYFAKLKLEQLPRRVADEEDVALSAMHSFCRGAAAGRFPQLADRNDLWRILVTITARKAFAQMRRSGAGKRGGNKVRGESIFQNNDDENIAGIEQVLGREPTPELANQVAEDCTRLLDLLADETLKQIATLKLEGYTNEEIAGRLGCVPRTIERKLERIREKWSQETAL